MCPICFTNDIGDEKHYFACTQVRTNSKLVEIRKTLIPEIHETFTPYPDVNSINDIYTPYHSERFIKYERQ